MTNYTTNGTNLLENSLYDASGKQLQWNALAKTSSVLFIVATICTFVLAFLIQLNVLSFGALTALMLLNVFFAFAAAVLWTAMAVYQAKSYYTVLEPVSSDINPIAFGPGFYILWVFFICSPLPALFCCRH